jgi:hypothetical protein
VRITIAYWCPGFSTCWGFLNCGFFSPALLGATVLQAAFCASPAPVTVWPVVAPPTVDEPLDELPQPATTAAAATASTAPSTAPVRPLTPLPSRLLQSTAS